MTFSATVLCDSAAPNGSRVTTIIARFPRPFLAELNTHRMLSKNSASSRAIPVEKQLRSVMIEPYVPERFGINEPGMQSNTHLEGVQHDTAMDTYLRGRDRAVLTALELLYGQQLVQDTFLDGLEDIPIDQFEEGLNFLKAVLKSGARAKDVLNVHKQFANRIIEPYLFHTVLLTGTDWSNFFALRDHPNAQPEIHQIARLIRTAMAQSTPRELEMGEWHLPFVTAEEQDSVIIMPDEWKMVSAGRSARLSYETHFGIRDPLQDIDLATNLRGNGHMSPFEHPCTPTSHTDYSGNFRGFLQLRKTFPGEADYSTFLEAASV